MNAHSVCGAPLASDSIQQTRREARARQREREILDAAVEAFAARGFFQTKVSEIARLAGVADGTIYLYFRSKDAILIKVFEVRMEDLLSALNAALAPCPTPRAKLETFARLYLSMIEEDRALATVLTIELRQSSTFVREYSNPPFRRLLQLLESLVEEGQADGSLRSDLPARVAARTIFGALDELLRWGVLRRKPAPAPATADHAIHLLLDGLVAQPDP